MRARLWFYGISLVVIVGLLSLVIPNRGIYRNPAKLALINERILCDLYVSYVLLNASNNPAHPFLITNVSPQTREYLSGLPRKNHWAPQARYLVSTQPLMGAELEILKHPKNRQILIVCDTPCTKLPNGVFSHRPPIHVVGYSDGETGLISPAEFAALDRSTFKRLDELFPESTH